MFVEQYMIPDAGTLWTVGSASAPTDDVATRILPGLKLKARERHAALSAVADAAVSMPL